MRALWLGLALAAFVEPLNAAERARPLMRDFMGINGHTVQFRPLLYAPVAKLVRDYHPLDWDVGQDTAFQTTLPMARNGVDWAKVYGSWTAAGLRVNACVIFDEIAPGKWKDRWRDAAAYGEAFARALGPSGRGLVESLEIGNEPGKYSDVEYREVFHGMAEGVRKGDPRLLIATCAMNLGPSGRYSKSVDLLAGLEGLYDVLTMHLYAEVDPWPTWRRSFPEDPATKFVENLGHVLKWRADNAPNKQLWLTEFGWDATTKPGQGTGDFAKWVGSTETQQAQWIVRAWMLAAAMGLDRAYLYFFNDDDKPQLHGSSGLTRNFQPKPSYHAAAWLQRSLGDYRFSRALRENAEGVYAYEFAHGTDAAQRIVALWKTAAPETEMTLPFPSREILRTERMPLREGAAEAAQTKSGGDDTVKIAAGESPVFVWLKR